MRCLLALAALTLCACGPDSPQPPRADAPPAADTLDSEPLAADVAEPLAADAPWTAGLLDLGGSDRQEVLAAVRTARHDGFDRAVFEFEGTVPQVHLEYVDRPVRACGSGNVVELPGEGWLQIQFSGARAHTEAGSPTVADREPGLPVLLDLALTCDFEGEVTWVAAVEAPNPYRAFVLDAPARLVVDVRHGS